MQKIIFILVILLSLEFTCNNAIADRFVREKVGPNVYKTYRIKDPEVKPNINWREKTTTTTSGADVRVKKEIIHETVCFDYEPGSIVYRNCRQHAKELFEEKCEFLDKKYRETKRPYDKEYKVDRDKFCRAASGFSP